jgi:putative ABC transport system permease protein
VTVVTTFVCGLAPAFRSIRKSAQQQFAGAGKGASSDSRQGKARAALVVAEVALSVVLLISAGLMMRTFLALRHVDLGFDPDRVLLGRLPLPVSAKQDKQLIEQVLQRVSRLPGVTVAAGSISTPPYAQAGSEVVIPGRTHSEKWATAFDLVSEGYFQTLNLQLLRGRLLTADDVDLAHQMAVVNRAFVQKFLGDADPIGQRVKFNALDEIPDAPHGAYFEIIGVVTDQKNDGLQNEPAPEAFLPYTLFGLHDLNLLVGAAVDPSTLLPAIRHEIWAVDRNVALTDAGSLRSFLQRDTFANPQFELFTLGAFAAIGMLLVVIGIFSVMAYTVSLRTHEIGVRMALGARQSDILGMVLNRGLTLISGGVVLGLLTSFGLTRYLANQVWGVSVTDPWTYCGVVAGVIVVGLASCFAPARHASKVDPMVALRYE